MADNEEPGEKAHAEAQTQIKIDQVRTIPGAALLRTIPGHQARFMMAATPVQASSAVICTASSSAPVILPQQSATVAASQTTAHHHLQTIAKPVNRINTVPIQAGQATSYHVPRGAAAVANIAAPRSSVATPIIRAPSNLQNIGVTQQHTLATNVTSTGGSIVGRSIVGVQTGYVGVPSSVPPSTVSIVPRHSTKIPPPQVGPRLTAVGSHIRPTETQSRPVVLQTTTTHKQVTLTHQVTDKSGATTAVLKSFGGNSSGARLSTGRSGGLPPMVPLGSNQGAVLVGPGKTSTPARVVAQSTPTAIHHQQSTIISSAVLSSRPVVLGNSGTAMVRSGVTQQAKIYQAPEGQPSQQPIAQPIFIQHKPQLVSGGIYSMQQQQQSVVTSVAGSSTMVGTSSGVAATVVHQAAPHTLVTSGSHAVTVHTAPHVVVSSQSIVATAHPVTTSQPTSIPSNTAVQTVASLHTVASTPSSQATTFIEARQVVQPPRPPTPASLPLSTPTVHQQTLVTTSCPQIRFNPVVVVEAKGTPATVTQTFSLPLTVSSEVGGGESVSSSIVGGLASGLVQALVPKQNTSPRPSILRKRDPDGWSPLKAQKNLMPLLSSLSVTTSSTVTGGAEEESANQAGSGGSSTLSAASSPGEDTAPILALATPQQEEPLHPSNPEVSPRKKPRKQQLPHNNQASEPSAFSDDEMEFISQDNPNTQPKIEYCDEQEKRKRMTLWKNYKHVWKSTNNHFMRYSDVKTKEEKKPTLSELANQKQVLHKINGWKIYHLLSQIEDMENSESEYFELYSSLLNVIEEKQQKIKNKDFENRNEELMNRINERIKANAQRCKVVKDHMEEARSQIMKLFDHKTYVADLINRCANKRTMKKRERL